MTTTRPVNPESLCPICGGQNHCAVSQAKACIGITAGHCGDKIEDAATGATPTDGIECWCMHREFPPALKSQSPEAARCICASCVDRFKAGALQPLTP